MLTLTNRIDMRPGAVPLVIHLGQYDSDFSLVFELYSSAGNFTVESGTTAMIRGTKTDGNAYDADATIDVSAKTVTVAGSEQMTAAKGRNVYELVLKKGTKVLSTANFILDVERAAMDADTIASESVLKELNAIIAGAETATEAATNAASAADRAEDAAESVSSAGAQIATNTADIADLKADFEQFVPGLSVEAKEALLNCFAHLAWENDNGEAYLTILRNALYEEEPIILTANYSPDSGTVFVGDDINDLKSNLVVSATTSEGTTILNDDDYRLSGTLSEGTNTIIVSYMGATTTFNVSAIPYTWKYVPSDGLLSEQSYINFTENATGATEVVTGDELEINVPIKSGEGSWFRRYGFVNASAPNSILRIKAKNTNAMMGGDGETAMNMGFRPQLSNGTSGAQMFINAKMVENDMCIVVVYNVGTTQNSIVTQYKSQEYHDFEVRLSGNTQNLIIDGESLFEGNVSQNYAAANVIFAQANAEKQITVAIKEIVYAELGGE